MGMKTRFIVAGFALSLVSAGAMAALTQAQWVAACTSGSPTDDDGCFGNAGSTGFAVVNDGVGGFLTYAGINKKSIASNVFIKAFSGTSGNTPSDFQNIVVNMAGTRGKCELFTMAGTPINYNGIANQTPVSGDSSSALIPSGRVVAINHTQGSLRYAVVSTADNPIATTNLFYVLCVGYNTNNNASSIAGTSAL